jgi:rhodanese-related sulfurtransferase
MSTQQTPLEITADQLKARLEAGEAVRLIDVREPHEFARCRIAASELIPMRGIPQQLPALREKAAQEPLVLYCHHGVRSLQAALWLRRQGLPACQSLRGGIDSWSVEIDPTVPRY